MDAKRVIPFAIVLLFVTMSLQAGVIPGRWEKVAAERPGSTFLVSLRTGDRLECAFVQLTENSLIVSTPDGVEREYSKANVERITTIEKRQDGLANGAVIGALAAGIPAGIIALAAGASCKDCKKDAAIGFAVVTGIGAAIGLAVDASIKDQVTLYEAPPEEPEA